MTDLLLLYSGFLYCISLCAGRWAVRAPHPSNTESEGGRAKPTRGYAGAKVHQLGEEPEEAAAREAAVTHGQDRLK